MYIDDDDIRSLIGMLRDAESNYENEEEMIYDQDDEALLNKGSVARNVPDQLNEQEMNFSQLTAKQRKEAEKDLKYLNFHDSEDALTSAQHKEELKDLKFLEGDNNDDDDDKLSEKKELKLIEDLTKLKKQSLKRNGAISEKQELEALEDLTKLKRGLKTDYTWNDYDSKDFKNFLDFIRILRNH